MGRIKVVFLSETDHVMIDDWPQLDFNQLA
jgi:hypothetical protein